MFRILSSELVDEVHVSSDPLTEHLQIAKLRSEATVYERGRSHEDRDQDELSKRCRARHGTILEL